MPRQKETRDGVLWGTVLQVDGREKMEAWGSVAGKS